MVQSAATTVGAQSSNPSSEHGTRALSSWAAVRSATFVNALPKSTQKIRSATIFPFNLPAVIGLSTSGGFEYMLESLEGADPTTLGAVTNGLLDKANQDPRLTRVFSTYGANAPSLFLDIDREKAQELGVNINDIFSALQSSLGGLYINDFNLFGRTWQVNLQGDAAGRRDIPAL